MDFALVEHVVHHVNFSIQTVTEHTPIPAEFHPHSKSPVQARAAAGGSDDDGGYDQDGPLQPERVGDVITVGWRRQ